MHRDLLAKVSIFNGLDADTLEQLGTKLKVMTFSKDGVIVSQDDPGNSMFIIKKGRVKVGLYGDSGREVILSILREGDFFGEMSLLDGQPRSAMMTMQPCSRASLISKVCSGL